MTSQEAFEWLSSLQCCSFTLTKNDDHTVNYVDARQWIEEFCPEHFVQDPAEDVEEMKRTNTIWSLYIFPSTPNGHIRFNGPTMLSVVERARKAMAAETS